MKRAVGGRWLVLVFAATVVVVACSSDSGTGGTAGTASPGAMDAATASGAAGGRDSGGSSAGPHDGGAGITDAGSDAQRDAGPCVATVERCDGLDDDCDGKVDEDLTGLKCGRGACRVKVAARALTTRVRSGRWRGSEHGTRWGGSCV